MYSRTKTSIWICSFFVSKVSIHKILPRSLQHYNRHVLVYDYIIGTSWGVYWFFCRKNKGLKHSQLLFLGIHKHGIVSRFHHSFLLKAFSHFFSFLCLLFFSTLSWVLGLRGPWALGPWDPWDPWAAQCLRLEKNSILILSEKLYFK